ncbi:hypothetical protein ACSFA8_26490 [Variovorax sp. RT4R15]
MMFATAGGAAALDGSESPQAATTPTASTASATTAPADVNTVG